MKISRFVIFPCLLFSFQAFSQLVIGWSGAYMNPKELNREIHVYDKLNGSGLTKQMQNVHWCQGLVVGLQKGNDDFFGEITYNRKTCIVASQFDSAGIGMKRQMKVQSNSFNFGVGRRSNGFVYGASLDFGKDKGKGRRGQSSGIKKEKWNRLWTQDSNFLIQLQPGMTFYVGYQKKVFGIRIFYQWEFVKGLMDGLDHWMFGYPLNGTPALPVGQETKFSNAGIALTISLGKN